MGVQHGVRRTLIALAGGAVLQRLCQLASFVLIGRSLGVSGLGVYAQGMALAAAFGVLTAAGLGQATARRVAAQPAAAGALVRAAVRRRFAIGVGLVVGAGALASATAAEPWFWWLCVLQTLPAACDQKPALDAGGQTRADVGFESAAALVQLGATAALALGEVTAPAAYAAVALGARCLHALGMARAILRLPGQRIVLDADAKGYGSLAVGQIGHELLALGDVWLVALALGDAAAGLYGLGSRFAAAALVPSMQLARLLLPHHLHAAGSGDGGRTLTTALRATALATWPLAAGGAIVADGLCALSGEPFAAAAPTLRLLLLAGCAQHLGWQFSLALLANHRDAAYGHAFGWPAVAHASALALLPLAGPFAAEPGATAAAAIALCAQTSYALGAAALLRPRAWLRAGDLRDTALVGAATAAAAGLAAAPAAAGAATLPLQLLAGGAGFAGALWLVEFRGRLGRLGDGLAAASSLRR
jgi:O-antigen/teichoic acid export membrane protein